MRLTTLVAAALLAFGLFGCATKTVRLPVSAEIPAAMGDIKIAKDDNGNTLVHLEVEHFAPPQRLQPPRAVYVVWIETSNGTMYNIGQLTIDKNLDGEIKTVTPYEVFRIVITAEDYSTVTSPSQQVVLTSKVVSQ